MSTGEDTRRGPRWIRLPWYLGLLWVAGCFDLCSGAGQTIALDREAQAHEYRDTAVWSHARTFLSERASCELPETPTIGEWHECSRLIGSARFGTRVRMTQAAAGYTVVIQTQSETTPGVPNAWRTDGPLMIELMQRADPASGEDLARRRRDAEAQLSRGCQPVLRAGCALGKGCWKATEGC